MDEKSYAEKVIKEGLISKNPKDTLYILAKYFYSFNYKPHKVYQELNDFMASNYKNYNPVKWDITLDYEVKRAKKKSLVMITGIPITKSELEVIQKVKSKQLQRLAFTLLCISKFNNMVNEKNHNWVNRETKEIFSLTHMQKSKNDQSLMMNDLKTLGLIRYSQIVDNTNVTVNFVDNESEVILLIDDCRELGYEYLKYLGEKFINCQDCGRLVKVNNKDNQTARCKECQHEHLQQLWRESKQRNKVKNSKEQTE